ncbi:cell division transport system permease protein [Candidatus Gastranaerophilus sp. (ex Termes propinquus)]|nr:cell division transport system permease protein [Candidatus Gastranaerophilus sp. (ex Termes propinquus)]
MTSYYSGRGYKLRQKVKSHIPKDWMTEFRITYRIVIETLKGIKQTGLINIAIITTMAAILTIFGCLFRATLSLTSIVNEMGTVLEISAYLKDGTNAYNVAKDVEGLQYVKSVTVIPKKDSWNDLKKEIDVPDIANPLPDTLHVKVIHAKEIENVMVELKKISSIEDIGYAKDLVEKFQMVNQISHSVTLIVVIIVCTLTILIINNTIELVIQSRKDEIEIMRLMGVSNWYIKFPLVLQGAVYGFLGALIAIVPMNAFQTWLQKAHTFLAIPPYFYAQSLTVFAIIFLGVAFSAGGSFMSIKKHLQV